MIGIFDSGLGGLTALAELRHHRPDLDITYYADTAHLPYGAKSEEDIRRLTAEGISHLIACGADTILVACGTASSVALPRLTGRYSVPLIGVVEPAAHLARHYTKNNKIGVIGTAATVRSRAFEAALRREASVRVFTAACPLLVHLAENGFTAPHDPVAAAAVAHYLAPLREAGIDTLLLGCTHFPLLAGAIAAYLPHVRLIGAGEAAADALLATRPRVGHGNIRIEVSHSPGDFAAMAERVFSAPLPAPVTLKK